MSYYSHTNFSLIPFRRRDNMLNTDIQLNKIIQSGVYYADDDAAGKKRPYVIITKDQGYSIDVLAFKVTSKFKDKKYVVPININGKISFIICSETINMEVPDILSATFVGILNPDVFNICTTLYASRFMNIDMTDVNRDMCEYLNILEDAKLPLYGKQDTIFTRELLADEYMEPIENDENNNKKYDYRREIKKPSYFNSKF